MLLAKQAYDRNVDLTNKYSCIHDKDGMVLSHQHSGTKPKDMTKAGSLLCMPVQVCVWCVNVCACVCV